jgi:hypothetical protein
MKDFVDKTSEKSGTPINRANLMAIQGFVPTKIEFIGNTIIETYNNNEVLITRFNEDGSITEEFSGEKIIKKTTLFNENGSIEEVIS